MRRHVILRLILILALLGVAAPQDEFAAASAQLDSILKTVDLP